MSSLSKTSNTPVLTHCRQLIRDGFSEETILEVYRGELLAMRVKHIGLGSKVTVRENSDVGPKFTWYKEFKMVENEVTSPSPMR